MKKKYNKYLILKGCAGLGNRLITLTNAIDYSAKTGRVLVVDWSDGQFSNNGENAFTKYFELKDVPHLDSAEDIPFSNSLSFYTPLWKNNLSKSLYELYIQDHSTYLNRLLPSKINGTLSKLREYWRVRDEHSLIRGSDFNSVLSLFHVNDMPIGSALSSTIKKDVVVFADFCPLFIEKKLFNNIILKPEIQKEISGLSEQYKLRENTIGVHVRMTDKTPQASLDSLIKKIKGYSIKNPQIFLATDNRGVENIFKKEFDKLISLPKNLPDLSSKNMGIHQVAIRTGNYIAIDEMYKNSILDMWLLSECEHLIYQKNSTFSTISATLKFDKNKIEYW